MPPRHAYWTILVDDQPTAFRAHDPEELLPTLNRLREKHSSAVMKWFERGQLWESRDAARQEGFGKGERRWEGERPDRSGPEKPRDRTWRPGGEHRDPRQKFKDAKKAKWQRFKQNIRERHDERRDRYQAPPEPDPQSFTPPHGDPLRPKLERDKRDNRPAPSGRSNVPGPAPSGRSNVEGPPRRKWDDDRRSSGWKPKGPPRGPRQEGREDRGGWQNRPQSESRGRSERREGWKPGGSPGGRKPGGGWKPKGPPRGDWRDRPPRDRDDSRSEWRERPPREKRDTRGGFGGDKKPYGQSGDRRPKPFGDRKPFSDRKPFGDRRPSGDRRPAGDRRPPSGDRKPWGSKPGSGRSSGFKPRGSGRPPGSGGRGPGGPRGPRGPKKPRGNDE